MAVFGAATVPALLGVSFADELIGVGRRALLNRLAQLFILAMGARLLWRAIAAMW
jgi:sulfite exporter TauE/SafE